MTVHGAKGLEAPVVILADTTTPPKGSYPPTLLEIELPSDLSVGATLVVAPLSTPGPQATGRPQGSPLQEDREGEHGAPTCIVWAGRRDLDVRAVAAARQAALDENEHEYRRLLYVAMTRAAEHLVVCGCHGKIRPRADCWYELIRKALDGQPGFEEIRDGEKTQWRYRNVAASPSPQGGGGQTGGPAICDDPAPQRGGERRLSAWPTIDLPAWLTAPAPTESNRSVVVSPSSAYDEALAPQVTPRRRNAAHEQAQAQALARGTLIHRLLQSLPDIEPARREAAAHSFLARAGAAFSADERHLFVSQALAIFADPRFAELFAPGSRAEVPIVGRLARACGPDILVSGQIDRLATTAHAVLIADYKTNRDPPASADAAPPAYVGQLALYRAVLGKIYRDRPIRAALVWTEKPDLMELPADMLAQAVVRITSG
jgi:ATP-dependent helicase/nuclease subunit A